MNPSHGSGGLARPVKWAILAACVAYAGWLPVDAAATVGGAQWARPGRLETLSLGQVLDRLPALTEREVLRDLLEDGDWPHTVCDGMPLLSGNSNRSPLAHDALTELVRRGPGIVPFLCAHMDDARPVRRPVLRLQEDARIVYDENPWGHRSGRGKARPSTVQQEEFFPGEESARPDSPWRLTVGDLCYFALGQIVNRKFFPIAHSGGPAPPILAAPSRFPLLRDAARKEWGAANTRVILASLTADAMRPDRLFRDVGAIRRLKLYFPGAVERVASARFRLPILWTGEDLQVDRQWRYRSPNYMDCTELVSLVQAVSDVPSRRIDAALSSVLREAAHRRVRDERGDMVVLAVFPRVVGRSALDRRLARSYIESRLKEPGKDPNFQLQRRLAAAMNQLDGMDRAE